MTDSQINTQLLLNTVKVEFERATFKTIEHVRLSIGHADYESHDVHSDDIKLVSFEGLSKAVLNQQLVMIKWSVVSKYNVTKCQLCDELKIRDALSKSFSQNGSSIDVIPTLCIEQNDITFNNQSWQLTYYAMPYYKYGSVKDYLKNNILNRQQKLVLIEALAQAVKQLHEAGWVHGDIKPSNFLIIDVIHPLNSYTNQFKTVDHSVCLTDLSCATPLDKDNKRVNQKNIMGTPAYLAPECWSGNPISIQSDIYAFGITVFEIMMGKRPYSISSDLNKSVEGASEQWAIAHRQQPIPFLKEPWRTLQSVLDRMLAKQSANRYQDLSEFLEAFNQCY